MLWSVRVQKVPNDLPLSHQLKQKRRAVWNEETEA